MNINSAIQLIEDTFNAKFDENRFTLFIKNFLNDMEQGEKVRSYSGNYIWDDHKDHINTYKRIGKYIDPEGDALDVLIVEVKSVAKLERARTALRNFVIKHLGKFDKDYALVAFYSKEDNGTDWRFSFIKLEHQAYLDEDLSAGQAGKQKVKTRKEFTPAKRYSFLVGKYEKAHTAKTQILPLLQNIANNPTIREIESAFSIEKVTDEFFGQYKDLYVKLFEHFENDAHIQSELAKANIDNTRFTKKLLGQIVFLYFLQKKGWLGVPQNEHWGKGKKRFIQDLFEEAQSKNLNYFKDYLQPLFYEALAKERNNENSYYKRFDCRIPFLNGGLFEAEYDWESANITIPENLFRNEEKNKAGDKGTGVLDVFDRYNFTIKEDEPLDKEVAVDPEMLGKVFENMLEITERKSKGAFYTPREIVHYMCQESLIHYLDNGLNSSPPFKEEYPKGEVVKNTSNLELVNKSLNNLPHLKTFRKNLRNNLTPAEATLWKMLQGKKLGGRKFRRQHSVANYILDFYCPAEKLAVELDGQGHFEAAQAEYDYERDLFLQHAGIKVLRFENKWVWENTEGLLQAIKDEFGWNKKQPPRPADTPPLKGGELKSVPKKDIETYIREGHFALENDQRVANKGTETKDYKYKIPESIRQNADLIDRKLTEIRICDPAIGSGAFPVGLLHELVNAQLVLKPHLSKAYLNKKLDGYGFQFQEPAQSGAEVSINESRYVYRLKRHIIQESIYGVDIDASAIDIARLRLWLSLVVDEDDLDPIETLPNLDYKIVCGNSLIGMPENAMHDLNVEKELETLKQQFYDETNESKKKDLRTRINTKIRELLDSAEQFAGYKIDFDFKLFFSEVWHEKGGFDVVIGNPPYGATLDKQQKIVINKTYSLISSETAILFIEKAFSIINKRGSHSYIIPKPFTYSSNYSKARYFVKNALQEIVDCGKAFKNVKFEAVIIVNNVNSNNKTYSNKVFTKGKTFKALANIDKSSLKTFGFYLNGVEHKETEIANTILRKSNTIGNHCNNTRGGMLQAVIVQEGGSPVIGGKEISKYGIKNYKGYIKSTENIDRNAFLIKGSILVQNIVAHITKPTDQIKIIGCIPENQNILILDTINQITPLNENLTNYLLWHLFHSEIINWYCYRFIFGKAIRTMHFDNTVTNRIPLPIHSIESHINVLSASEILYHYIRQTCTNCDLKDSFFRTLADSIIYELYFPEELKSANKEILKHLGDLPAGQAGLKPITPLRPSDTSPFKGEEPEMSNEEKLAIIQAEFERLYDPSHPVRNAIETLDSIEEVRIIKESLNH